MWNSNKLLLSQNFDTFRRLLHRRTKEKTDSRVKSIPHQSVTVTVTAFNRDSNWSRLRSRLRNRHRTMWYHLQKKTRYKLMHRVFSGSLGDGGVGDERLTLLHAYQRTIHLYESGSSHCRSSMILSFSLSTPAHGSGKWQLWNGLTSIWSTEPWF